MHLNNYQDIARSTATYPDLGKNIVYPVLKLAGEAGEVSEKLGKLIRDKGFTGTDGAQIGFKDSEALAAELGDVIWYIAAIASELGYTLTEIAEMNLAKLADRKERGVLSGSGDNR